MFDGKDVPTDEQEAHTAEDSVLNRRRFLQVAGVGLVGATVAVGHGVAANTPDRLEVVAPAGSDVEYSFDCGGPIARHTGNSLVSAEADEDVIRENDDGTWTASGNTADGYGDAFEIDDDVHSFQPETGDYVLYLNGERIKRDELVEPPVEREHSYAFEGTGDEWADYYLEVEDGADMVASTLEGAVIEDDFHWVSADGTKAAGRVNPGERHAYEFDNLVLDVTIDGEADAFVDGNPSSLEYYPRPGATGDDWKSGFPWQTMAVDREHSYAFEGTGDEWADYYLEVEDDADMVASTLDGAIIERDFHWVSEDGTKAAGRIDPGERHAYEFDNLVLDVTIDGEADAFVDGSPSSLDYYPLPGATGDGWKGGFPWQEDASNTVDRDGIAMGGGQGYADVVTREEADVVVSSASGLGNALSAASSGDVVFVASDAVIDTGGSVFDVPRGVTLASNRGQNGAPGALLETSETPQIMLRPQANARVTGLRVRGPSPGETVTYQDGIAFETPTYAMRVEGGDVEVDNCEVWGWPDRAVYALQAGAHVHHNYIYDNNGQGLGYGVSAAEECLIEYNYFHNNRHSVTAAYDAAGYTARYNHFSPVSVMQITDVHDPFEGDTTFDANIIENGESRTWDANVAAGLAGYSGGFNGGSLTVTDNWYFEEATAYDDGFAAVSASGNVYGDEDAHDPADVIPNHPGLGDRPWA